MANALDKTLRAKLERTIKEARDIAENAARAALEQLGVGEPNALAHLSSHERQLRRELRIHGRQLSTPEYSVPPLPEHSVPVIPEQYVPPVPEQSVPPRQVGFVTS